MRVLITGGGTGGHIYPGIAIAKLLIKEYKSISILFVGTEKGLESDLIPKAGFKLETIPVKGFRRKLSLDILITVKESIKGIFMANRIIKKFKPDVVVGTGGYVCGPVVLVAAFKKIPAIIHEQNVIPGITNRILERFVKAIAVSFEDSRSYFKSKSKLVVTGNPIREAILQADRREGFKQLGLMEGLPVVLSVGGSRGAEPLNQAVIALIEDNLINKRNYQIIMVTGQNQYENVMDTLEKKGIRISRKNRIKIVPYLYDIGNALAAADLIISRAGAVMLAEITAAGIPAVLIPSPYVTNNHQEYNARIVEKHNGAKVILEKNLDGNTLAEEINLIIEDKDKLKEMGDNCKKLAIMDAAERICNLIVKHGYGN